MYNTAFDDVDINNLAAPDTLDFDNDQNNAAYISLSSSYQGEQQRSQSFSLGAPDAANYSEADQLTSIPSPSSPLWKRCIQSCGDFFFPPHKLVERSITYHGNAYARSYLEYHDIRQTVVTSKPATHSFSPNVVKNTKYTPLTFIFVFLYNEFRFFFNLYFLIVALSQFVPVLQVGFLFTYVAPLCFVLAVSMIKEIYDDIKRYIRDKAANSEMYSLYIPRPSAPSSRLRPGLVSTPTHNEISHESVDAIPVVDIASKDVRPGDIILLHAQQRVPCDCIVLKVFDKSGTVFIKTDQLDGETDWKLRSPPKATQTSSWEAWDAASGGFTINAEAPKLDIYDFKGNIESDAEPSTADGSTSPSLESLGLENTLWGNTTVASCPVLAMAIYTGCDSRSALNANQPRTKTGALDMEVNYLSKILFTLTLLLAVVMTILKGFHGLWFIYLFRYLLLFSSIIPISLRVNLDMAKLWSSYCINTDTSIPDTTVRTSTIPEELGRISYIFTDKTGTLTTNTMAFKVLQLPPPLSYTVEGIDALRYHIRQSFPPQAQDPFSASVERPAAYPRSIAAHFAAKSNTSLGVPDPTLSSSDKSIFDFTLENTAQESQKPLVSNAATTQTTTTTTSDPMYSFGGMSADLIRHHTKRIMEAISLCHNVTPADETSREDASIPAATSTNDFPSDSSSHRLLHDPSSTNLTHDYDQGAQEPASQHQYQASSPDEVALVTFAASVGVTLTQRDTHSITFETPFGEPITWQVLAVFPFTSASKRMGILVRSPDDAQIHYFLKGAESAMIPKCKPNAWVSEEVSNLARVGLRTLVYGHRQLTEEEFAVFDQKLHAARASLSDRETRIATVIESIEHDLDCLGITGVEDKLQENIRGTLETLRNAGIKIWMLTGDKNETAACIGLSTRLVDRGQRIVELRCSDRREAALSLDQANKFTNACLMVDGTSLQALIDNFPQEFLEIACQCPTVICCRCSPTQKAQVVQLMKEYTGKRTLAIGDGGNDVSMIQAAHVGVGIIGKEGNQAAMSSDFSITQFQYLTHLLLWHGRNSYKRSSALAQFVMHRGMIISIIQAVFSALYFFVAVPVYNGWLMVGYTTIYTMFPVFSLVLDSDISKHSAFMYPELYRALQLGKPLSLKTFFVWVLLSVYQGGLIMILGILLFESSFVNIVSITFSALILSELLNVIISIKNWVLYMVYAQLLSVLSYLISMAVLKSYFDITFITSLEFIYKVAIIVAASALPPALVVLFLRKCRPSDHNKISQSDGPYEFL